MIHLVCVNVGPRYGMEYVEILFDMLRRNASTSDHEMACWCVTDRPDELPAGVAAIQAHPELPGWWQKTFLFSGGMPWNEGDRVVYFDLDVVITGRLEDLLERKGIIRDWHWPCFNSSVMVWDHGEHRAIWTEFDPDYIDAPPTQRLAGLLPKGQVNGGDQEWITEASRLGIDADPWEPFPAEWFVSYRAARSWPPNGCKAVIFHGSPKPDEVTDGWVTNVWKLNGFTSLPHMDGVNVTYDAIYENVRANVLRDLPWFGQAPKNGHTAVLVAGGPSMRDNIDAIRKHKRRGAHVFTVNNAMAFLRQRGITPDVHVMLDARAENAAFVADPPESTTYMIASQCHPDVFDALANRNVILWHNGFGDNVELREILDPWWDGASQKPIVLVPGGGTVGLRTLWLLGFQGYKEVHIYGMDSSYTEGRHHAYPQALNDADAVLEVALKDPVSGATKTYHAARWMVRQAEEFRWHWRDLGEMGVKLHVHGKGLIPDIAKHLTREAEAA